VEVPVTFGQDRRVYLGKEPVGLSALAERLRQLMINRADKQVFLRADGRLFVQSLVDVWGELKAAGVENVGIVTEVPTR
jgi:biopolymer transport protein TolR